MTALLGNISLILAFLLVVGQVVAPQKFYRPGAIAVFTLIFTAFLCLAYSYVVSDFSVLNVYNNSSILKPIFYKITGTWGNHEGSMLLLVLILSLYNLVMVRHVPFDKSIKLEAGNKNTSDKNTLPEGEQNIYITAYLVQLLITAGFL